MRCVSTTSAWSVRPYAEQLGGGLLAAFAACNFRMNEFTGAVLKGQLTEAGDDLQAGARNSRKVREGIADLPGLKLRKTPDVEGDIGVAVFLEFDSNERRDHFLRAMRAEGIGSSGPGGSAVLPADERIEKKVTIHPEWPSFTSPEGKAIQYGSRMLPADDRHPRSRRWRDHGSEFHQRGPERHRPRHS